MLLNRRVGAQRAGPASPQDLSAQLEPGRPHFLSCSFSRPSRPPSRDCPPCSHTQAPSGPCRALFSPRYWLFLGGGEALGVPRGRGGSVRRALDTHTSLGDLASRQNPEPAVGPQSGQQLSSGAQGWGSSAGCGHGGRRHLRPDQGLGSLCSPSLRPSPGPGHLTIKSPFLPEPRTQGAEPGPPGGGAQGDSGMGAVGPGPPQPLILSSPLRLQTQSR